MRTMLLLSGVLLLACVGPASTTAPTERPEPFVCRFKLNPMYLPAAALQLPGFRRPFAKARPSPRAGVELTLPYGPASQGARLTFTSGWVTMRVRALPDDGLKLRMQAPLALSEVLTLGRGGHVTWTGSDGERLVVTARRPPGVESTAALTTAVACEDTTIASLGVTWPADPPGEADAGTARWLELPAGTRAPVSLVPGAPAAETLLFEKDDRRLKVMGEVGDAVRVRVWLGEARLEGYVPRALLREEVERSSVFGMGGLLGSLSGREGGGQPNHARCAAEAPLELRMDGRQAPLGTLWKNAAWREVKREGGWVEVALPELDWVQLEPGAALLLSEASAAACAGPR